MNETSRNGREAHLSETSASGEGQPPPGRGAILLAALIVGLLLMGVQLWLLTVALDLYLSGQGRSVWTVALISGLVFVGGVVAARTLARRPVAR